MLVSGKNVLVVYERFGAPADLSVSLQAQPDFSERSS